MGSKTVFYQFSSQHSMQEVENAAYRAFIPLGGEITKLGNGLSIKNGKSGVQYGFTADLDATLTISQPSPDQYELICAVNWKMNALTIISLIVGIFVFGILWIFPLLYLFIDPSTQYQQSLTNVRYMLSKEN